MRKPKLCIWENKAQVSFALAKLISAFVFATQIVRFFYFLNPKFPVSSHLLCLYASMLGLKPHCWFSHDAAQMNLSPVLYNMSRIMRKRDFCLGENKGADQLRGNREADQRLCFHYSDSTIPLLLKSKISSF